MDKFFVLNHHLNLMIQIMEKTEVTQKAPVIRRGSEYNFIPIESAFDEAYKAGIVKKVMGS